MGLDLVLGGLVLTMAIRGWFKGFVLQAIRLGGLVVCVYVADPVRDLAKPYVLDYLPSIQPALIDRMLWWASAVISYVVLVGLGTLIVKLQRRQPLGLDEPDRTDQFAGSLLGMSKGLVVAALLAAGIQDYALDTLKATRFGQDQTRTSRALQWTERYRPVSRVWSLAPVQHFVHHVQRMGLNGSPETGGRVDSPEVQTASRSPRLELPSLDPTGRVETDLGPEVAKAVEAIKDELRRSARAN